MDKRFGGLAANVGTSSRMTVIYPVTGKPVVDSEGKEAYIELMSQDSAAGRQVTKDRAAEYARNMTRGKADESADMVDGQIDLIAALVVSWYLVDPVSKQPIDFPFNGPESAKELFSAPELQWLRRDAYVHVVDTGNFMRASPND